MAELTQEKLKDILNYNPDTGCFTWKNCSKYHREKNGLPAGTWLQHTHNNKKYLRIRIMGKTYAASRLALLYMTGEFPNKTMDHINGDSTDNRILNLKEVDLYQNNQNHTKRVNGSGLPTGVKKQKNGTFSARITHRKKVYSLGCYKTPKEAGDAYTEAKLRFHYCPAWNGK